MASLDRLQEFLLWLKKENATMSEETKTVILGTLRVLVDALGKFWEEERRCNCNNVSDVEEVFFGGVCKCGKQLTIAELECAGVCGECYVHLLRSMGKCGPNELLTVYERLEEMAKSKKVSLFRDVSLFTPVEVDCLMRRYADDILLWILSNLCSCRERDSMLPPVPTFVMETLRGMTSVYGSDACTVFPDLGMVQKPVRVVV